MRRRVKGSGAIRALPFLYPIAWMARQVLTRIELVKKNYARGKLLRVLEKSPQRMAPGCGIYGQCGGCQLLAYEIFRRNWSLNGAG